MTEILKIATRLFGFTDKIESIGSYQKLIYNCSKNDLNYILKIVSSEDKCKLELLGEIDFVNYLNKNGASVQGFSKSINRQYVEEITHNGSIYYAYSYKKLGGNVFSFNNYFKSEKWDKEILLNWGEVTGKLVCLSRKYKKSNNTYIRPEWYNDPIIKNFKKYIPSYQTLVMSKIEECLSDLHSLHIAESSFGLIQGDFHKWNFYFDGQNITMDDFDDCEYHWLVNEIAMPLFYGIMSVPADKLNQFSDFFMTNFLIGFKKSCAIDKDQLELIPNFLQLRMIVLYVLYYKESTDSTKDLPEHIIKWRNLIESGKHIIDLDFSKY